MIDSITSTFASYAKSPTSTSTHLHPPPPYFPLQSPSPFSSIRMGLYLVKQRKRPNGRDGDVFMRNTRRFSVRKVCDTKWGEGGVKDERTKMEDRQKRTCVLIFHPPIEDTICAPA